MRRLGWKDFIPIYGLRYMDDPWMYQPIMTGIYVIWHTAWILLSVRFILLTIADYVYYLFR